MPAQDLIKASKWREAIQEWCSSGLSADAWCREKGVVYSQFLYWRRRLDQKSCLKSKKAPFIELAEEPTDTWIEISLEGVKINITKNFDRSALLFCLRVFGGH